MIKSKKNKVVIKNKIKELCVFYKNLCDMPPLEAEKFIEKLIAKQKN